MIKYPPSKLHRLETDSQASTLVILRSDNKIVNFLILNPGNVLLADIEKPVVIIQRF